MKDYRFHNCDTEYVRAYANMYGVSAEFSSFIDYGVEWFSMFVHSMKLRQRFANSRMYKIEESITTDKAIDIVDEYVLSLKQLFRDYYLVDDIVDESHVCRRYGGAYSFNPNTKVWENKYA
jgi:hypothetical protein